MNMNAGSKTIRTLWSWLRGASWSIDRNAGELRRLSAGAQVAAEASEPSAVRQCVTPKSGVLLSFPFRGEALLVKLADELRSRVENRWLDRDPMLLLISRCPGSRLWIDGAAYVEFHADRFIYFVSIEARPDTKVTLETTDFDAVVQFVVQYVAERLSEPLTLDVAS